MNVINLNMLPVYLDENIEFGKEYYQDTAIKRMENFHVDGVIRYNLSEEVEVNLHVTGDIILEDAITLEEVTYPIDLKIAEIIDETDGNCTQYLEKSKNTLDKLEFLWENIVLEVPISFTKSSGINLKGEGWELNSNDEEEKIDPRLAKLNDLFKGGE